MVRIVGRTGEIPKKYVYRNLRAERRGFINVVTFEVSGIPHRMEMTERGSAVAIMPVDYSNREIYMITSARFNRAFVETPEGAELLRRKLADVGWKTDGLLEVPAEAVRILEFPAGMIDPGETPVDAAVRELEEETGIRVGQDKLTQVASYFLSIGGSTERITAFIADITRGAEMVPMRGDGTEEIEVLKVGWGEALGFLESGQIETASGNVLMRELKIRALYQELETVRRLAFVD